LENSVKSFFEWKNSPPESLEDRYKNHKIISQWKNKDVLYSFLGIYQIGIYVCYPEECNKTDYVIKRRNVAKKYFDLDYLTEKDNVKQRFEKYDKLNEIIEHSRFIKYIDTPGNVIPIWPGGNVDKGTKAYCFDIPDIYFTRYKSWFLAMQIIYPNSFLDGIINSDFSKETNIFLNDINKESYELFLTHIVKIIHKLNICLSDSKN